MDPMSKTMALLIEENGEIATPRVAGLADADHPGGSFRHIRDIIDSAQPEGFEVPNTSGLVVWFDGLAFQRMRRTNMVASFAFAAAFDLPLQALPGPLMITGGSVAEPQPLTPFGIIRAARAFGLALEENEFRWLFRHALRCRRAVARSGG